MASCMRIRLEEYIKKERTGSDNLLIELRFLLISLTFFSSFVLSAQVEETLQEPAGNDSTQTWRAPCGGTQTYFAKFG